MKKVIVFDSAKVDEAKVLCESLCGIADNVSYSGGDDESAEAIDKVESGMLKIFDGGHVMEVDDIMSAWFAKMCEAEIVKTNEMIRMENLWAMGSNTVEQSQIHVENMMRLEKYKTMLSDMQEMICE